MNPARLPLAGASALAIVLLAGCAGTPAGPGSATAFPTRDVGTVTLACGPASFLVSLNDDDDNNNHVPDRSEALNPTTDDNVRELFFSHPTADAVYVADIVDTTTNQGVVGVRVRAYEADRHTPFKFNTLHPTSAAHPLKLCLEGKAASAKKDDFGFEFQFYKDGKPLPCGGAATGTVVDVKASFTVAAGGGTNFARNRKMLITSAGNATATVRPAGAGTIEWTYDAPANVTIAQPAQLTTAVTAGTSVTGAIDHDELRLKVHGPGGHDVEAHFPVNLTAPQHTEITNHRTGFTYVTGWVDANQGQFGLFPAYLIDYRMLDQFRAPIHDSAYGSRTPQIRENIGRVMTSPLAPVQAWITTTLHWSPNWLDKPGGTFTDRIEANGLDKAMIIVPFPGFPGRKMFDSSLQQVGGVLLQLSSPHVWQLSVNGDGIADATANAFSSTVSQTRPWGGGTQVQFTSTYAAHPQ